MAAAIASPVFVNGADDDLLVGDTVEVVTAEASVVNTGAGVNSFEELTTENGEPEKQNSLMSDAGKAFDKAKKEVTSSSLYNTLTKGSPSNPAAKVAALSNDDEDAANSEVAKMKKNGELGALEGNEKAIDKLVKATGLEKRLSDITPGFDKKDYNSNVKLKLLQDYDWSRTACDKSMKGLLNNMSSLFPNISFGDESDSDARQAAKDTSLLAAMRCGAKWLTDDKYDDIIADSGVNLFSMSDKFLTAAMGDFQDDKQVRFARKLIDKMSTDEDGNSTLATARIARYNPRLVNDILKFYPWGYQDSYDGILKDAYLTLVADLDKIDPNWHTVMRGTDTIVNLELYYKASSEALHVLSYDDPHATNVAIVGSNDKVGYQSRMYNGIILPAPVLPRG
jgi:hypothetical protein